jgi:hypothetical protein
LWKLKNTAYEELNGFYYLPDTEFKQMKVMWHLCRRREMHLCIDRWTVLKLLQKEQVVMSQKVFTVLRVWTSGRLF